MKRITILAAAGALVATPALGVWAANAASDDKAPAPQVKIVDDHGRHQRHTGTDDKIVLHLRHGADDPAGHHDHGNHAEPGDDHGNHAEPGDDNGGGNEPGDDNGGHGGHGGDDNGGHGHGGNDD
jgi:hypothetical protein